MELAEQYTNLAMQLAQMLQVVWQFAAFITLGAIGWGLTSGQNLHPPSVLARLLVALGLVAFYAMNIYVLWNLLARLHAAQSLAKFYAARAGADRGQLDIIYQPLPDYLLTGTAAIGLTVVVIVFILMGPMGRRRARES